MRPIRLILSAFGPFAQREEIDFTRLPPDALFLIHGPTGAGKTSILDGICYALYGETSGSERSAKEMRSHHAADDALTEVEFEFGLGRRRYRVKRSPEQERAALRGKKDQRVRIPARAELQVWDGDGWKPLVSKATEVTQRLVALLGFEADQFRQVILLPQGQFRKLLAADSKEREQILETLFATETCKRLQERLKAAANALERQAEEAKARKKTLLEQAGVESEEALGARIEEATAQRSSLAEEERRRRAEEKDATAALAAAEALARQFEERDRARAALDGLSAAAAAIATRRRELDAASRAQFVRAAHANFEEAAAQRQRLAQQLAQAEGEVEATARQRESAESRLQEERARAPERERAIRELERLEGLREAVRTFDEARREAEKLSRSAEAAEAELARLQGESKTLTEQRARLQQAIEADTPLAGRVEALRRDLAQQERLIRSLQQLDQAKAALAAHRDEETKCRQALEAAQTGRDAARVRKEDLEARWRSGQAAVLALHLSEGAPCPVCGSLEHPAPATAGEAVPSEEELNAAAKALQQAESALESVRAKHQAVLGRIAGAESVVSTLEAGLPPDPPSLEQAKARLVDLERDLARALEATKRLDAAKAEFQACEQRLAALGPALEQTRSRTETFKIQAAAAAAQVRERSDRIPEPLRDVRTLEQAIDAVRKQADTLAARLKAAEEAHQQASTAHAAAGSKRQERAEALDAASVRLAQSHAVFLKALQEQGFADEAAFREAMRSPEEIAALRAEIQSYDESVAAAKERLQRAENQVAGKTPPNLAALKAAQEEVRRAVEQLVAQQQSLEERIGQDRRTCEVLAAIGQELGEIESRYEVMGHLAGIANGDNGKKLTFQRFVLAALLDDVLRQASLRLRTMSRGRYSLQRREDVADARRASGLDLEVFDEYTGRSRPASTLSGGESFMAALSLALGLSDVVQAYAGGIQLDTLFIDEGFGSLDPESLDMAMKALSELRQKGRMVGIISHVDELKRQIDVGIEVIPGRSGSQVRVGAVG